MKTKDAQRAAVFATVVIGSVIAVTSSAFACGSWRGKLTVTGNGDNYTGQSVSVGSGIGMTRCASAAEEIGARIEAANDETLTPTGTVKVKVEPTGAGICGDNRLGAGIYTVNLVHEAVRGPLNIQDCMNGVITGGGSTGSGNGYPIGSIVVNGSGNGTATIDNVLGPQDMGRSILCVSSATGDQNNQVQLGFI